MTKLTEEFYLRNDVTLIAQELLGKLIKTNIDGVVSSAKIVETEAYSYKEKACHAYLKRNTHRTSIMFKPGGHAYVYLCYGIHHLFNVVTNLGTIPEAVLIRAVEPVENIDVMRERRNVGDLNLTSGPGKLSRAMGIDKKLNGISLLGEDLWIEEYQEIKDSEIVKTTRIGVEYAKEDALLPWRYYLKGNPFVSKK